MSGKKGKSFTLKDLITEKASHEEKTDFDYVEKEMKPSGEVPEFYARIKDRMKELEGVESQLRLKARIKNNPVLNSFSSMYGRAMQVFETGYQGTTVDVLVNEQIRIMDGLNEDVGKAIYHSRAESSRLHEYADKVLDDFENSKKGMQQSDSDYNELQRAIGDFESRLTDVRMEDDGYTPARKGYDDARRGFHMAYNMREEYAVRVKVRLVQRKTALVKEEIVNTVLYELQKMGDHLEMFLEEVQQTSDATALSQYAYQTAEALRDSYGILSDISQSRSIISRSNVGRLMNAVNSTNYDFPQETLKAGIEQDRELRETGSASAFREMKALLSKPVFEEERDFRKDGRNDYGRNGYDRSSVDLLERV